MKRTNSILKFLAVVLIAVTALLVIFHKNIKNQIVTAYKEKYPFRFRQTSFDASFIERIEIVNDKGEVFIIQDKREVAVIKDFFEGSTYTAYSNDFVVHGIFYTIDYILLIGDSKQLELTLWNDNNISADKEPRIFANESYAFADRYAYDLVDYFEQFTGEVFKVAYYFDEK